MDCDKAGDAMMQYVEKTIKPMVAIRLARHVHKCESCREYFLALDETAEAFAEPCAEAELATERVSAPEGFTEAVMARIRKLPVYAPIKINRADIALRVVWGLCAVLLGVTLGMIYHPETAALIMNVPFIRAAADVSAAGGEALRSMVNQMINSGGLVNAQTTQNVWLTNAALIFVFMLAGLLAVLRRAEKSNA